jgi:hypothetical protein
MEDTRRGLSGPRGEAQSPASPAARRKSTEAGEAFSLVSSTRLAAPREVQPGVSLPKPCLRGGSWRWEIVGLWVDIGGRDAACHCISSASAGGEFPKSRR